MDTTLADPALAAVKGLLAELRDRLLIQDLVNRYAHFIREQDVEGVLSLFVDDAMVDFDRSAVANGGPRHGKAALRTVYEAGFAAMAPWPTMANHIVDLDGPDRARGSVCIELRQGVLGYQVSWVGRYDDVYVKRGGEWKFQSRLTEVRHVASAAGRA